MEKLKDAKNIKWKEIYTDRTNFLKNQFDAVVGKGSYRRWEGKEIGGSGEWYVIVSPADVHEHKRAKFFSGIRKMPDSYPAGGKYFDTIKEAYEYAFETWGTPRPKYMPNFTAGDLKGISKRIDDWKFRQEELKPQSFFKFDIFRIRNAMAQAATFKDLLSFDLNPFIPLIEEILAGMQLETLGEMFTVLNSDETGDSLYVKILERAGYSSQDEVKTIIAREADQNKALAYTTLPGGQRKEWLSENRSLARQRGTEEDKVPQSGGEQFFQMAAKVCTIGRMKRKRLMDEFISQVGSFDKAALAGIGPKFYRSNFEEAVLSSYSQHIKNQKRIKKIYDFTYYAYENYTNPKDLTLERKIERGEISNEQAKLGRIRVSVLDQLSKKYDSKMVSEIEKIKIEREISNIENIFAYEVMSEEELLKQGLIKRDDGLYTKEGNYKKFDRITFEDAVKRMQIYLDKSYGVSLSYDEFKEKLADPQFAEKYEFRDTEIPLRTMITYGRRDSACGYWFIGPYFSEKPYHERYYFRDETFTEKDEFGFTQLDYAFLASNNIVKRPGPDGNDVLVTAIEDKIGRGGRFTYKYEPVDIERAKVVTEKYKEIYDKIEEYIRTGQVTGSGTKRVALFGQNLKSKDFEKALDYIDSNFLKDFDIQTRIGIKESLRKYLSGWGFSVKSETEVDAKFDANLQGRLYGAMYFGHKAVTDKVALKSIAEVILREATHLYKYSAPASSIATVLLQFKKFSSIPEEKKAAIQTLESKLIDMGDQEIKMQEFVGMVGELNLKDIILKKDILYIYGDAAQAGSTIPLYKVEEGKSRAQPFWEILGKDVDTMVRKIRSSLSSSGEPTDYQKAVLQYSGTKGHMTRIKPIIVNANEESLSRLTLSRILKSQVEIINGKPIRVLTDDYIDKLLDKLKASYVSKFSYKDSLEPGDLRPIIFTNRDGVDLAMLGLSDYAYYKMMKKKFKDLWGLSETAPKLYEDILRCYFIPEQLRSQVENIGAPTFILKSTAQKVMMDEKGNDLVLRKGRIFSVVQNRKGETVFKPVPPGLYAAEVSSSPVENVSAIEAFLDQYFSDEENVSSYRISDTFASGYNPYNNEHPDLVRRDFKREEDASDMKTKLEVLGAIQETVSITLAKDIVKAYQSGDPSFVDLFPGMESKENMDESQKEIMKNLIFATNPTVACSAFIATVNADYSKYNTGVKPEPANLVNRRGRPKKIKEKNYQFPEMSSKIESGDQSYNNFVTAMGQDPNKKLYLEDFIDVAQKIGLEVSEEEIRAIFNKAGSGVTKGGVYKEFSRSIDTIESKYGISSPYRIDNFSAPYGAQQTMSEIISKVCSTLGYSAFLSRTMAATDGSGKQEVSRIPLVVNVSDNAANFALIVNSSFVNHCQTSSMVENAPEDISLDDDYVRDNPMQSGVRSRDLAIALRLGTKQGQENISQVSSVFTYATAFKNDLYRMIRESASRRSGTSPVELDPFLSFTPGGEDMVVWYEAFKEPDWGEKAIVITANLIITWVHVGLPESSETISPQQLSSILGVNISTAPGSDGLDGFGEIERLLESGKEVGKNLKDMNKGMSVDKVNKKRTEVDDDQESGDEGTAVNAVDKPAQDKAKKDAEEQAQAAPEIPAEVPPETPAEVPLETPTPEVTPEVAPEVVPQAGPKKIRTIKRPGQAPATTPTGQPLDEKVQAPPPAPVAAPVQEPVQKQVPTQKPTEVPSAPKKVYKIKKAFGPTQKNESYDKTSLLSLIRVAKVFNNRGEYLKAEAINSFVREALVGTSYDKNRKIAVVKTLSDLINLSKDFTKRGKIEDADEINKIVEKHLGAINKK